MPKTSLTVLFGRNALIMKTDVTATVNAGGEQSFAPAADLENENSQKPYATYEPDFWLLDGSYKFAAEGGSTGYVSTELSGADGAFTTAPELQFDFGATYNTNGLTLHFGDATGDYCDDIDVAYYESTTAGYSLLQTDNYTPTGTTFSTGQAVTGFDRIIITLNATNNPYRFARLVNIDFDTLTRWSGANIKRGKLVEQINLLSLEIPSNEIEFTLYSSDGDFSILSPSGAYSDLQENEPIEAYEQVGDATIFLGRFYLDAWESLSEREARFTAYDAITLLNEPQFYCSINDNYYYDLLIAQIMAAANVEYEIDASLLDVPAWGTYAGMLPVMSCRDALQQVCFALGAYVTCARSRVIRIRPFALSNSATLFDVTLDSTNKGKDSPIKLKKAFTALELLEYAYSRMYYAAPNTLYSLVDMPIGTYTFTFETPTVPAPWNDDADVPVSPDDYGRYWVRVTTTSVFDFAIADAGYYFDKQPRRHLIDNNTVPATTPTNVITIDKAYLVKADDYPYSQTLTDTIQRVVSYHLQRIEQTTKTYGLDVGAGYSVSVVSQGSTIYGTIERAEIDLTGGFVASLKITGETDRAAGSVIYNNDDARFTYSGFPSTNNDASHYMGDIRYSPDTETGFITFWFIGYQLNFIYRQFTGGGEGEVTVYIDGAEIATIDQNGTTVYQQVWTSPVLENTYHIVKLAKVGTTGTANLDAVEVFYR